MSIRVLWNGNTYSLIKKSALDKAAKNIKGCSVDKIRFMKSRKEQHRRTS